MINWQNKLMQPITSGIVNCWWGKIGVTHLKAFIKQKILSSKKSKIICRYYRENDIVS